MINFPVLLLAALVPLIVGFVWYNPKVFGPAWMKANNFTEADMNRESMVKTYILTYIASFFAAFAIQFWVIHQLHVYSSVQNVPGVDDPTSQIGMWLADFNNRYGHNFRTFKHGMLHGFMGGLFLVYPAIAINAMFEKRVMKYTMINGFYWVICIMLMGGIICQWA